MSEQSPIAFTAAELAERLGGTLRGPGDLALHGVNGLDEAGPGDLTFIVDGRRARGWAGSAASAALVTRGIEPPGHDEQRRALIVVPDAEQALIDVLEVFAARLDPADLAPGVHPAAVIDPAAHVPDSARIGPHVSIGARARLGERVRLHAGVRIYGDVTIGDDTVIHANCVIRERCVLGRGVILHQGVSIGADGFGYRPSADGSKLRKMPHIGTVIIEDDVEIGANTCVDRGKFGATVVGRGTKLDNLVQVGHNVRIGRYCVVVAESGIGGSARLGNWVRVAGCVGIADNVSVGDGASIGAMTGVTKNVPPGETWIGFPAEPAAQRLRQWAALRKLPGLIRHLDREGGAAGSAEDTPAGPGSDTTHAPGS